MKTRFSMLLAFLAGVAVCAVAVQGLHAAAKPPVYVVTEVDITDLQAYQRDYVPLVQASIKASGGRLVAAGQNAVSLEGSPPAQRVAINEFDSLAAVLAWRASEQYKDARKIGDKYGKFRAYAIQGIPQ
jgi:uncharacterized protein (DUF1330 family)